MIRFAIEKLISIEDVTASYGVAKELILEDMYMVFDRDFKVSKEEFINLIIEREPAILPGFTAFRADVVMITNDEYRDLKLQSIKYNSLLRELGEETDGRVLGRGKGDYFGY